MRLICYRLNKSQQFDSSDIETITTYKYNTKQPMKLQSPVGVVISCFVSNLRSSNLFRPFHYLYNSWLTSCSPRCFGANLISVTDVLLSTCRLLMIHWLPWPGSPAKKQQRVILEKKKLIILRELQIILVPCKIYVDMSISCLWSAIGCLIIFSNT